MGRLRNRRPDGGFGTRYAIEILRFHRGLAALGLEVVQYFNAGPPQDAVAGAAAALDTRFTRPRVAGSERGQRLSKHQARRQNFRHFCVDRNFQKRIFEP